MSKGPYRVVTLPRVEDDPYMHEIHGPTPCKFMAWDDEFADTAKDVCEELNLAHHTARREAIEECIRIMKDYADRCRHLDEAFDHAWGDINALLGAGEKENNIRVTAIGNVRHPPVTVEEALAWKPPDGIPTHLGGLDDGELANNEEPDRGED